MPLLLHVQNKFFSVLAISLGVKKYVYLMVTIHSQESLPLPLPLTCINLYKRTSYLEKNRDSITVTGKLEKISSASEQLPCTERPYLIIIIFNIFIRV